MTEFELAGSNLRPYKLSLRMSQVDNQAGAYTGFSSIKRLRVFLLPLNGMPVHGGLPQH